MENKNLKLLKNPSEFFDGFFSLHVYGSPDIKKVKHIEAFEPLINYIKSNFVEAFDFIEYAYKNIVERSNDEEDE